MMDVSGKWRINKRVTNMERQSKSKNVRERWTMENDFSMLFICLYEISSHQKQPKFIFHKNQ